jgi:hypothetical protein
VPVAAVVALVLADGSGSAPAAASDTLPQGGFPPDLIGTIQGPATACPGEEISNLISVEVTNQAGDPSPKFFTGVYLSPDPIITSQFQAGAAPDTLLIGGRESVSFLGSGATINVPQVSGIVPAATPLGAMFLGLFVDDTFIVGELKEDNNTDAVPIDIVPCGSPTPTPPPGVCETQGLGKAQEHPEAEVAFTPKSGPPGMSFEVDLRSVDQNDFGDEPAEARWDDVANGGAVPILGTVIGQGTIPTGETMTMFDARVPGNADQGVHQVTVCWRLNIEEKWYFKIAPFDVTPVTPTPTLTPTPPTPTPTPTPAPLPLFAVLPLPNILPIVFGAPDLSIHGIEMTQAIQCFDTSNGLGGCPDNSLALVAQKHTTARIYPRYAGPFTEMAGVPVRLHLFANGVEYIANSFGTAKKVIDQASNDNANIWYNVNFSNGTNVTYYAEVDPDNVIAETNETNNRFPAVGTMSMNFFKRQNEPIVGWRMRYHPPGFVGNQFAGGWAVNGGGVDYLEDAWPIRQDGIPYSVRSGFYDRTTVVTQGNTGAILDDVTFQWILQNLLGWLFGTGELTGADQVFVWTPNSFFVRGLSDPAFAGGLGIAAIGDDTAGTSIDSPGFGAVNFAHEITHNQNVKHTATGVGCDNSPEGSPVWPYANAGIQEFGYNPDTGKIFDPSTS